MTGDVLPERRLSERRFRAIVEQAFEMLVIVDGERIVQWANAACERVLGYTPRSLVGRDISRLVHEEDVPPLVETIGRLSAAAGAAGTANFRMRAMDGSWHWMETSATNLSHEPSVGGLVVVLRDVTEQRQVDGLLRASEARYSDLVEHALDAIYTATPDGNFTRVNRAAEQLSGFSRAELLRMNFFDLIAPEEREQVRGVLARRFAGGRDETVKVQLVAKDGRRVFVEVVGRLVEEDGKPGHLEGIARDATERHLLEDRLRHQVLHDELTGLPNRTLLLDRLGQALARGTRSGFEIAVMLLDVDDFKLVNDSLGHAVGDQLLVELARRLDVLRGGETVARLGGDEFAFVAEGLRSEHDVVGFAERLQSVFVEPFAVAGTTRHMTGSLGIALTGGGASSDDLLRDADMAMYRVKATGKNGFEFFDDALRAQLLRQVALRSALESVLRERSLELFYQPIVSLADGRILAVEALVRWQDPQWGWVQPGEFIPLAEANGLIVPLGRYVLDEAVRQTAQWRKQNPETLPLGVFVNVSPRELSEPSFVSFVTETLVEHGLTASDIAFELTERVFIDERNHTLNKNLADLAKAGIRIVLDDFGTGYSALASLNRFPLAALKIDRFFIRTIRTGGDDDPITRAIISLGKTLHMAVIAEGVETEVQLDCLRRLGCDAAQGFLLARPQPPDRISYLLFEDTRLLGGFDAGLDPGGGRCSADGSTEEVSA